MEGAGLGSLKGVFWKREGAGEGADTGPPGAGRQGSWAEVRGVVSSSDCKELCSWVTGTCLLDSAESPGPAGCCLGTQFPQLPNGEERRESVWRAGRARVLREALDDREVLQSVAKG